MSVFIQQQYQSCAQCPTKNSKTKKCQSVCKPGSVWLAPTSRHERGDHSSGTSVTSILKLPTRTTGLETGLRLAPRVVPIRYCSRWGLQLPRSLLTRAVGSYPTISPLPFFLAKNWRSNLCCTFPQVKIDKSISPGRALPGIVYPWSPDFPPLQFFNSRSSDHPTDWQE